MLEQNTEENGYIVNPRLIHVSDKTSLVEFLATIFADRKDLLTRTN